MGTSLVAISVDGKRMYEQKDGETMWHTYEVRGIDGDVKALLTERDSLLVVATGSGGTDRAYILSSTHPPIDPPEDPQPVCGNGVYELTWQESAAIQSPSDADLWNSLGYGNGLFLAGNVAGRVHMMTSQNGMNWVVRPSVSARSFAYGNGLFVAVSAYSVQTSPDGITWTERQMAANKAWTIITYGSGLFVTVASDGVMTSPNGIVWTSRQISDVNTWSSITFGNGLFVAVAPTGTHRVMTSPDGITWTARQIPYQSAWSSITFGNGLFVAVAPTGTHRVMTSPDGITWTAHQAPSTGVAPIDLDRWSSVTYGNGLFVAVSRLGAKQVMTSPDGIHWASYKAAFPFNSWTNIVYGDGKFVAVGTDKSRVMVSSVDHEQCDDGNQINTDSCSNTCKRQN